MKGKIIAMVLSSLTLVSSFTVCAQTENIYGINSEKTLILNEDPTDFAYGRAAEGISLNNLTAWADQYVNTNVGAIFLCTQAYRSNYGGNVMETIWEHKDRTNWTGSLAEGLYSAQKRGLDINGVRVKLLRERNISPWVSLRMNDIHDSTTGVEAGTTSTFKGKHNYNVGSKSSGNESYCLDYNLPQVRNFYYSIVRENIERYDVDGIELDWQRECYAINDAGYREETRAAVNSFMRDIRKLLDFWEIERGHEIKLAVRVPATVHVAENSALDAKTWSKERLVDLVTVTARWSSLDTDMPMEEWIAALKNESDNQDIQIGAGLEVLFRSNPSYAPKADSIETASGAAYSYLSRGADYIYLFNHMDKMTKMSYNDTDYILTLNRINSLENISGHVKRHVVTYRDKWASDETPSYALPATCSTGNMPTFNVHIGTISAIKDSEQYSVILGTNQNLGGEGAGIINTESDCTIKVNGITCEYMGKANDLREPTPTSGNLKFDLVKYHIPAAALQDGYNTVTVTCADGTPRELTWVEIYVEPITK